MILKTLSTTYISEKVSHIISIVNAVVQQWSKRIYYNLYTAFLLSSLFSYFSLFHALPYLLNISFFIGSLFFSFIFGINILLAFVIVIKMIISLVTMLNMNKQDLTQSLCDKNLMTFTYNRYS